MAHTLEDTDGSGEVVDTASSLQGSAEDLNGGDEIVGEAVVQVALNRQLHVSNVPIGRHEGSRHESRIRV